MSREACQARLLGAALDGAHPAYFDGIPRELLMRARHSPVGRRMLLRQLVMRARPLLADLFSLNDEILAAHLWVLWDAVKLHQTAADLGAIALVPGLRACVDRASVLRLRGAIGSERLAMALTFLTGERIPDAVNAMARRVVSEAVRDMDAIAALVARHGYRELAGYAERIHPAVGERVRLAFRPEWHADPRGTWLPAAAVARYFSDHAEGKDASQPAARVQDADARPAQAEEQSGEIAA